MSSSIASGSSGSGSVANCESKNLKSTIVLNGKIIPFITTDLSKKKLLLSNFPARVSTPSKSSIQLLENNSHNFRDSFTDFSLQTRTNTFSRHNALTEFGDTGFLNIHAT